MDTSADLKGKGKATESATREVNMEGEGDDSSSEEEVEEVSRWYLRINLVNC